MQAIVYAKRQLTIEETNQLIITINEGIQSTRENIKLDNLLYNLTSIQLRPMKGKPWEYLFFLDLEGHRDDADVAAALAATGEVAISTRILGSYPRAQGAG